MTNVLVRDQFSIFWYTETCTSMESRVTHLQSYDLLKCVSVCLCDAAAEAARSVQAFSPLVRVIVAGIQDFKMYLSYAQQLHGSSPWQLNSFVTGSLWQCSKNMYKDNHTSKRRTYDIRYKIVQKFNFQHLVNVNYVPPSQWQHMHRTSVQADE